MAVDVSLHLFTKFLLKSDIRSVWPGDDVQLFESTNELFFVQTGNRYNVFYIDVYYRTQHILCDFLWPGY
jgi:hypothetical protein